MTNNVNIVNREPINLRIVWPNELTFSRWLASQAGLALIADELGVEIDNPQLESRPGNFPCDIAGNALGNEDHKIIIENQLEKTDHDHLGKLITHASVHSAMTGIWIAGQTSPDHIKAINWLNSNTPPEKSFYLAEIRTYKIVHDTSANVLIVPQLVVVSRPDVSNKIIIGPDPVKNATQRWRLYMWGEILGHIKSQSPPFNAQSPSGSHWSNIAIGRSGFWIGLTLLPNQKKIGCELAMNVPWKQDAFKRLHAQKDEIESEVDSALKWCAMPNKKSSRIILQSDIDPRDDTNLDAIKLWMSKQASAFHGAFKERVAALVAPPLPPQANNQETTSDTDEESEEETQQPE